MNKILCPLVGDFPITQEYGAVGQTDYYQVHYGIDYGCMTGTPVLSTDYGIVRYAGTYGGYGKMIKLEHDWGYSLYGHLSNIDVQEDQSVDVGDIIGYSGNTGNSTGPHLHFECRNEDDRVFNQTEYITKDISEVQAMLTFEQVDQVYFDVLNRHLNAKKTGDYDCEGDESEAYYHYRNMKWIEVYADVARSKEHKDKLISCNGSTIGWSANPSSITFTLDGSIYKMEYKK